MAARVPLPDGFGWVWADDAARVNLPPFVRTEHHVYEPVLSTRDAERMAEALIAEERRRRATNVGRRLTRILLAHDPRYAPETVTRFRSKLSIALVEFGQSIGIDEMITMSGMDAEGPDSPGPPNAPSPDADEPA